MGARESLNGRKNMARRKVKDGEKSPWGQCLTRPVRNASAQEKATRMSPFLAWGDFHARSSFARSTIPEEKRGTTRSLAPTAASVVIQ